MRVEPVAELFFTSTKNRRYFDEFSSIHVDFAAQTCVGACVIKLLLFGNGCKGVPGICECSDCLCMRLLLVLIVLWQSASHKMFYDCAVGRLNARAVYSRLTQ